MAEDKGKWLPAPLALPTAPFQPPLAAILTGTWDMVTDTLRGWTVNCTHCSRSEAKRWGSSARSQASCLEQLQVECAQVGLLGGPESPGPLERGPWTEDMASSVPTLCHSHHLSVESNEI